jgi:hypothetical protein
MDFRIHICVNCGYQMDVFGFDFKYFLYRFQIQI